MVMLLELLEDASTSSGAADGAAIRLFKIQVHSFF